MIRTDREALVCDLAETYNVHDMRGLPALHVATLASGLGEDSRIKRKMSGNRVGVDTQLQAMQVDLLQYLLWSKTKDAQHGRNKPASITDNLTKVREEAPGMTMDEFDRARNGILKHE